MLRVARELRKETEQFGVTSRQVTLLWLVKQSPGLTLRALAEAEAISAPALSGHIDRLERAGLLVRVRSDVDRRRVGLELTPRASGSSARCASGVPRGSRSASTASSPKPSGRSRRRSSRCASSWDKPREQRHIRTAGANVPQPPSSLQLPALLRRADRLARGLVDAERRSRVARALPLSLAAHRGDAALLPLRAVHGVRVVRGLDRRSTEHPHVSSSGPRSPR